MVPGTAGNASRRAGVGVWKRPGGGQPAYWPTRAGAFGCPKKAHLHHLSFSSQLSRPLPFPSSLLSSCFQYRGQISRFLERLPPYALRPKCCKILRNGNILPGSGLALVPCYEHGDLFLPILMTSKASSPISPQCKPLKRTSSLLPQPWHGHLGTPAAGAVLGERMEGA